GPPRRAARARPGSPRRPSRGAPVSCRCRGRRTPRRPAAWSGASTRLSWAGPRLRRAHPSTGRGQERLGMTSRWVSGRELGRLAGVFGRGWGRVWGVCGRGGGRRVGGCGRGEGGGGGGGAVGGGGGGGGGGGRGCGGGGGGGGGGSVVDGLAGDRAGHAVAAAAATAELGPADLDDLHAGLAQQLVGVGVPVVGEHDARLDRDGVEAAVPLLALSGVPAAAGLDGPEPVQAEGV